MCGGARCFPSTVSMTLMFPFPNPKESQASSSCTWTDAYVFSRIHGCNFNIGFSRSGYPRQAVQCFPSEVVAICKLRAAGLCCTPACEL